MIVAYRHPCGQRTWRDDEGDGMAVHFTAGQWARLRTVIDEMGAKASASSLLGRVRLARDGDGLLVSYPRPDGGVLRVPAAMLPDGIDHGPVRTLEDSLFSSRR